MNQILERIKKTGIIPVVVIEDKKDAEPLAEALCKGGYEFMICCFVDLWDAQGNYGFTEDHRRRSFTC